MLINDDRRKWLFHYGLAAYRRSCAMTMVKVIEVLAESDKSWEDAAQQSVADASKTVRNVKSIYLKNIEATVENGKVAKYRINAKISFVLED